MDRPSRRRSGASGAPDEAIEPGLRRELGAWYTPEWLVDHMVAAAVKRLPVRAAGASRPVRVLDPSCGDGRFLAAAGAVLGSSAELVGVDIDPVALEHARARLGPDARLECADALRREWLWETFDLILGNPPFLSQMATATARQNRTRLIGGAYVDAAAEFLALAGRLAEPDGGVVAMIQPLSTLAARDAWQVRDEIVASASIEWFWWSPRSVFRDAAVRACAVLFRRGSFESASPRQLLERTRGNPPVPVDAVAHPTGSTWSSLIVDGLPQLPSSFRSVGVLGDIADCAADFRDQYYGLADAVSDDADGPPLITVGLIDVRACGWGQRSTRFNKQRFEAPRVDLTKLTPKLTRWAENRLVPKVLVASQTRVVEAVGDAAGEWLPSVPVVSVVPHNPADVERIVALLSHPVVSVWAAWRTLGSGMSAHAMRISASVLADVPLPPDDDPWYGITDRESIERWYAEASADHRL